MILQNAKGQMTVFFATTILVLITFIAFIVNIGIFVKAKINLQNAVDAAAYAGASVQARQISNIAYLNWEMRNVYKEWMFKTYVLGNLSLKQVSEDATDPVRLTMDPFNSTSNSLGEVQDGYNIPSVCLDFSASGNVAICRKALVAGLPQFPSTDVLGMEETLDAFVDALGQQKAEQCAARSNINFLTNFLWGYNVPGVPDVDASSLAADAPEVAADRPGAFPAAFNLALRIRSLEAQVNKAPYTGVCAGGSPFCSQKLNELVTANGLSPADERIYKAFQSGWRNLSGTDCTGEDGDDELKCSFTLTELAPSVPDVGSAFSLSNLLIPASKSAARQKHYIDLKLMPVNYATFHTMLAPVSTAGGSVSGADSVSECVATKVGMPVPGYPLGFVKNPDVLTYYAVKGEAEFVGLFNPFRSNAIKLTAYAAAKPFGGRIGPMIFNVNHSGGNPNYLLPRSPLYKSSPYLSALDNSSPVDRFGQVYTGGDYQEGMPIPGNYNGLGGGFWLKNENSAIGGWLDSNSIFFAVPNIPYDYPGADPADYASYFAPNSVQIITPLVKDAATRSSAGLYNKAIFDKLKSNLEGLGPSSTVSTENINNGILLSRAPTMYDALNYLVPTPEDLNKEVKTDSYGVIISDEPPRDINGSKVYNMSLYAPLFDENDPNALYNSSSDLVTILQDYMSKQEPAIEKYRGAMNFAGKLVFDKNFSSRTGSNYGIGAANQLSGLGRGLDRTNYSKTPQEIYNNILPHCKSVNGKFVWFFTGKSDFVDYDASECDPKNTLKNLMQAHWNNLSGKDASKYYRHEFVLPASGPTKDLFTGYRPGEMNDANAAGVHENFLTGARTDMRRNFYSTKFISLKSVTSGADDDTFGGGFALFSEGQRTKAAMNDTKGSFKNYLNLSSFGIDISEIRH